MFEIDKLSKSKTIFRNATGINIQLKNFFYLISYFLGYYAKNVLLSLILNLWNLLQEKLKPNAFMPFGQGPHLCPGSELAVIETMFIIHHLVTNYRYMRISSNNYTNYVQWTNWTIVPIFVCYVNWHLKHKDYILQTS